MSSPIAEHHRFLAEARIAVESAIAVADLISQTDIVQSTSFNQLVVYLHDAVEALAKAEGEPGRGCDHDHFCGRSMTTPQHTIFPTRDAASEHMASILPSADVAYRLSRSGDGKCVVQVFRLSGLL